MSTLFGASNIHIKSNGSYADIILDKTSGSGLISKNRYYHGFFSAAIKLPASFTSGVVLAFYMSNADAFPHNHDEIDFELLGYAKRRQWVLVSGQGSLHNLTILIKRENKGIVITQSHYIEKILKKFNRENCSPVSTHMDLVEKLKPNTGKPVYRLEYSRAISCLMYAMTSTRPDIAYVKQTCITGSTMESEFVALVAAGKKAEWLRNLIHEILIWPKPIAPISIRCDSAPTMARAYSQIYNGKSRHLGARSKGATYVNMKFSRFKKLGLSFLYVQQWIRTHGL
nr:probable xyloglucan endotransglucosylase/hydrolase protein 33 [Tanacetum cinerariifolium]